MSQVDQLMALLLAPDLELQDLNTRIAVMHREAMRIGAKSAFKAPELYSDDEREAAHAFTRIEALKALFSSL